MIIRSTGILPCIRKSTSLGMNSCGWLSPWMTPRTRAAELQKRHVERDFGSGARAAEQHAGAARHQRLDRLAQDRRLRRRLEREAHAVAGDLADLGDDVGRGRCD